MFATVSLFNTVLVQQVDKRLADIESQVNPKLSLPDKEYKLKRRVESRDRCLAWSARIFGGVLLFLVFSSFFLVRFNQARKEGAKSQERHTVSKNEMEFPKIVICDNVNTTVSSLNNGSPENLKQISCSLNENGLLGEQRRSHSCTQPYVQKIKLYERNCLVYGNKSGGLPPQIATSASTTLRLVIDVGTHDGRLETPWNGAFMLIQNPFLASPPDFSAGLVRTYVLSPNVYHLVEMKRRAVYSPPVHTAFDGKKYSPPNNGFFQYIVNTPESGPLSKLYAARYNSQTIAVIDFQFTTLEQENIVEEKVASLFNLLIGVGGLAGLFTVGYIILSFVVKLCALCCCPDGECLFSCTMLKAWCFYKCCHKNKGANQNETTSLGDKTDEEDEAQKKKEEAQTDEEDEAQKKKEEAQTDEEDKARKKKEEAQKKKEEEGETEIEQGSRISYLRALLRYISCNVTLHKNIPMFLHTIEKSKEWRGCFQCLPPPPSYGHKFYLCCCCCCTCKVEAPGDYDVV